METTKTRDFLTPELPQDRALRVGAVRLQQAVAELPLRYAPFFGRLSALWSVSEERVLAELTRAKSPKSWSLTLLRGLKTFEVDAQGARPGERARLLHFAPGTRFPRHSHRGEERVLVLEGSYADASGFEVRPGEGQTMSAGTEHQLFITTGGPCIAAIVEEGVQFTGPFLRWATKLLP